MSLDQSDYEYRGLKAATWDLFRSGASEWEDVAFYRDMILHSGQPALDVGCGTGRLLLDYLSEGIDIDGVDNSPEMLALCREKAERRGLRPHLYRQRMQALNLPRLYRTIIVPSSSFQLLMEPGDAGDAMDCFYRHLEPGGTLVMPFMILCTGPDKRDTVTVDWRLSVEKVRADGATVRLWSRTVFDMVRRLEHVEDRFEIVRDGQMVMSEDHNKSPATCWYTQEQALALYEIAGFDDVHLVSGFTEQPAQPDDVIFCGVGTRP